MRLTWSPVSAAVTAGVHTSARTLRGPSSSVEAGSPPGSAGSPRRPRPPPPSASQVSPGPRSCPRVCPSEPLMSVPLQTASCHSHTPSPPAASPGPFPGPSGPPSLALPPSLMSYQASSPCGPNTAAPLTHSQALPLRRPAWGAAPRPRGEAVGHVNIRDPNKPRCAGRVSTRRVSESQDEKEKGCGRSHQHFFYTNQMSRSYFGYIR